MFDLPQEDPHKVQSMHDTDVSSVQKLSAFVLDAVECLISTSGKQRHRHHTSTIYATSVAREHKSVMYLVMNFAMGLALNSTACCAPTATCAVGPPSWDLARQVTVVCPIP